MNDVGSRLAKCLSAIFPMIPENQVRMVTQDTTEQWDSVASATLVVLLEEEFGIAIDAEDLAELESFESIDWYLPRRVSSKALSFQPLPFAGSTNPCRLLAGQSSCSTR